MGDGTGDPGYLFDDEITPGLTFSMGGRLAYANSGPNTNGSQFFITEDAFAELNGKYTIFGQCDAHSTLLAASIARVARDANNKAHYAGGDPAGHDRARGATDASAARASASFKQQPATCIQQLTTGVQNAKQARNLCHLQDQRRNDCVQAL